MKNHGEGRNKAARFSIISHRDLSLSAACSLPLSPWHTSGCPNMSNVSKTPLEPASNFHSISLGKSSYSFQCLCSAETALSGAWNQNLRAASQHSWLYPCNETGQQLSRASQGVEKGLFQNWVGSSVGTGWNPATLCMPSWAVVEMRSWSHFFPCSPSLCFLLLEPWSSSKWCYYVLQVIYSVRKKANCPLRVTIARIRESKYYLAQVPAIPHFVAAAMWISPHRLPHQAAFLLQGLQRLWQRGADREVPGCLAMLMAVG